MIFNEHVVMFKIKNIDVIGNFSNGSLIGLTSEGKDLCERLASGVTDEESADLENRELVSAMKEMGFFQKDAEKYELFSTYFHVTQRCNLNCLGCYSYDDSRNCMKDPEIADLKKAIADLARMNLQVLIISGGEPFFRKDIVEIVKYAKGQGIPSIQIITNGTMLKREVLEEMKEYVVSIAVSFDGYSKENPTFIRDKGIFDKLIQAVSLIKSVGISVSILPTIHSQNYAKLDDYVELSKELDTGISFSLLTCSPDNEIFKMFIPDDSQLRELGMKLTTLGQEGVGVNDMPINSSVDVRRSCEVGTKIISIGADGSVYPCHMLHDKELIMGNIFKEPLIEIMASDEAMKYRRLHVDLFETCKECEHKYLCGGGCRARSYYKNKNFESHDYYCGMTKVFFDEVSQKLDNQYAG